MFVPELWNSFKQLFNNFSSVWQVSTLQWHHVYHVQYLFSILHVTLKHCAITIIFIIPCNYTVQYSYIYIIYHATECCFAPLLPWLLFTYISSKNDISVLLSLFFFFYHIVAYFYILYIYWGWHFVLLYIEYCCTCTMTIKFLKLRALVSIHQISSFVFQYF